jgi:hypothetical protein
MRSLALGALALAACHRTIDRAPESAVRSFYADVGRRDCSALMERLTAETRARLEREDPRCDEVFHFFGAHPLERVVSVTEDGRIPRSRLISVAAARSREPRVFTVIDTGAAWRVRTF